MPNQKAFTLVEILMVLLLVAIIATVSIQEFTSSLDEAQFNDTVSELQQIKTALIGDDQLVTGGERTNFGFLGDIGRIPSAAETLSALITKPAALPNWSVNTASRLGAGWNGPYLSGGDSGADYTTDAWGNSYVYSPSASPPTIVSRGSDGAVGGSGYAQDITITLPDEKRIASLHGFISDTSIPFDAASEVILSYVSDGAITTSTDTLIAGDNGHFQFNTIPFGKVSLMIYEPDQATDTRHIGPITVTVDKPNILVPSEQTDFSN